MSFEGYNQYWCPNGHYYEIGIDLYNNYPDDVVCDICNETAKTVNLVNDTNLDDNGRIEPKHLGNEIYEIPLLLWLDDKRKEPFGWVRCYTPSEIINYIKSGPVYKISLDHDLGDDKQIGTGYDVLTWIEEQVYLNLEFKCPEIYIHTANPAARFRMKKAVESIIKKDLLKNS